MTVPHEHGPEPTVKCLTCDHAAFEVEVTASLIRFVFGNAALLRCPSAGCKGFKASPHVGFCCHNCGQSGIQHRGANPALVMN